MNICHIIRDLTRECESAVADYDKAGILASTDNEIANILTRAKTLEYSPSAALG